MNVCLSHTRDDDHMIVYGGLSLSVCLSFGRPWVGKVGVRLGGHERPKDAAVCSVGWQHLSSL